MGKDTQLDWNVPTGASSSLTAAKGCVSLLQNVEQHGSEAELCKHVNVSCYIQASLS